MIHIKYVKIVISIRIMRFLFFLFIFILFFLLLYFKEEDKGRLHRIDFLGRADIRHFR